MASHRKPRSRILTPHGSGRAAVGLTTAALASATLLTQGAQAAPRQNIEEVQQKVDELYRQAGSATQRYNAAKERTEQQRSQADRLLDDVAKRTDKLNEARRTLGAYAAAQYRTGGLASTATLLLADDPQGYFDQDHLMDRMTGRQREAVKEFQTEQAAASKKRAEAVRSVETLTASQKELRTTKESVQHKLSQARELLSKLTAEEKARLAELERQKEAEARRKAEELARQQAEAKRQEEARQAQQQSDSTSSSGSTSSPTSSSGSTSSTTGDSYATKAAKAVAFARAQIGKPYVWGAVGPTSYDCSGLTQAAWKAAGVSLPRTTWDQVKVGTRVATNDLQPGDLVFFYSDISHVGIYIGDGQMIHAPKPGDNVRIEPITYMPIYGSVRPA